MDDNLYYDDVMSAVLDHVFKDDDIDHLAWGVHDGTDRLVRNCYLARGCGKTERELGVLRDAGVLRDRQ